ncbi:MAG: MBL fold metallo-hydrolase [Desulfobacterales bacterium]|nr:MBL fold metallo-hydrolase [Desulfobacterales bacterium]
MSLSDWYKIDEVEDGIFVVEEPYHVQSFLINGQTHSALIDTGTGFRNIREAIKHLLRDDVIVLNTHWHFDHVGGNVLFDNIGISKSEAHLIEYDLSSDVLMDIYVKPFMELEIPFPDDFIPEAYEIKGSKASFHVKEGDKIDLGGRTLDAVSLPGHSHGSMAFIDSNTRSLIAGDFIYKDELYAHLEDSDLDEYIDSLIKLKQKQDAFKNIYPAHGEYPIQNSFIDRVLKEFQKIKSGAAPDRVIENFGERAHFYQFDDFSIFSKMPGYKGVKLIDNI